MNNANKNYLIISLIILIIFIGGFLSFSFRETGARQPVYVPFYGSSTCKPEGDQELIRTVIFNGETVPNIKDSILCGDASYSKSCVYEAQAKFEGLSRLGCFDYWKIYKCTVDYNGNDPKKDTQYCSYVSGIDLLEKLTPTTLDRDLNGDDIIDFKDDKADARLFIVSPSLGTCGNAQLNIIERARRYRLEVTEGNGFVTDYEKGCDLSNINEQSQYSLSLLKETKFNEYGASNTQVPFDATLNYIWGQVLADTSNIINKRGADSEDTDGDGVPNVFIEDRGYYIPIKKAVDGKLYVDTHDPITDNSIECVPSNVFVCNEDATLLKNPTTDVTGQSCSILRGVPENTYVSVGGGVACDFSCTDGKTAKQDCAEIPQCSNLEVYDSQHNQCLTSGTIQSAVEKVTSNTSLLFNLIIVLIGIVVAVVAFIILDRSKKFEPMVSGIIAFLIGIVAVIIGVMLL